MIILVNEQIVNSQTLVTEFNNQMAPDFNNLKNLLADTAKQRGQVLAFVNYKKQSQYHCHAVEKRHPGKNWIPAFAGMTIM